MVVNVPNLCFADGFDNDAQIGITTLGLGTNGRAVEIHVGIRCELFSASESAKATVLDVYILR
jgi:hypothetical protein